MSYASAASVVSRVFDAALSPESWPLALAAVASTVGAIGAAYIVRSKETAGVERISLSGPSAALEANYVFHYAAIDGYSPLIVASAQGRVRVGLGGLLWTVAGGESARARAHDR
jgi:hypothetical protein